MGIHYGAYLMTHRDTEAMQTLAAIAILGANTYRAILEDSRLMADPLFPHLRSFLQTSMSQSIDEASRFNAVATRIGGKKQDRPDQVLEPTISTRLNTMADLRQALGIMASIEIAGSATCAADIPDLEDSDGVDLVSRIGPVQASRYTVLVALQGTSPSSIPGEGQLPGLGSLTSSTATAIPNAFLNTTPRRPISEGAVR